MIGNKINLNDPKKVPKSMACDVLRYSIKESKVAMPNRKILQEIYKTFIVSNPGTKSLVSWSRADKEESAGMIKLNEGFLIISEK